MTSPIDPSVMASFFDDEQDIIDMLELLIKETAKDILVMKECCISGKEDMWYARVHKVRGASSSAGAIGISDICKGLDSSSALTTEQRKKVTDNIDAELQRVSAYLDKLKV